MDAWFRDLFLPVVLDVTVGKIVLICDNFSGHDFKESEAIKIYKLPPNVTSVAQPLDQGILNSLKMNYKRTLLEKFHSVANEWESPKLAPEKPASLSGVNDGCMANLVDVANYQIVLG